LLEKIRRQPVRDVALPAIVMTSAKQDSSQRMAVFLVVADFDP
jgi:hypothetical protein